MELCPPLAVQNDAIELKVPLQIVLPDDLFASLSDGPGSSMSFMLLPGALNIEHS